MFLSKLVPGSVILLIVLELQFHLSSCDLGGGGSNSNSLGYTDDVEVIEVAQLPYATGLRAFLNVTEWEGVDPEGAEVIEGHGTEWWHSLSRNNTIDCECGTFSETTDHLENWAEENVTALNIYPWSVSLVAPGSNYAFCGGSLVNDRYVLTSAACVDGSNSEGVEVLIGTWPSAHFTSNSEPDALNSTSLIRKKVIRVILHPKYLDGHLDHNIALLRLKGPVPTFGNPGGVSPVCLPNSEATLSTYDHTNASSLLWRFDQYFGAIIPKRRSEITWSVLSQSECRQLGDSEQWENMPESLLCTSIAQPSIYHPYYDTYDCPGDAGGPLLADLKGKKVQVGVDSWTSCYGKPSGIGIFNRITAFLGWINLHISKDGRHCSK